MLDISELNGLHIEASTYCNARCPQCPRNFCGWNAPVSQELKHINLKKLKHIIQQIPMKRNFDTQLCGNYGDPMMHPQILDMCDLFPWVNIVTNGSIGTLDVFRRLGEMQKVYMHFSIDGLEDTNHIYRQGVDWHKVMERVSTYINAGGKATWKFIVFRHNQHQVQKAKALADQMGFWRFEVVHGARDYGPILNNTGEEIGWLLPADRDVEPYEWDRELELENLFNPGNLSVDCSDATIDCMVLRDKVIYIDADCNVLPCCYHGVNTHIQAQGETLQEQLNSFAFLQDNWGKKDCDEICYSACKG